MAGFWENDQVLQPKDNGGFWNNDAVISEKPKGHQYSVLPVSEDEKGNPHLDFNAGIFGPVKRAYDYFSKTVSGQEPFDPTSPEAIRASTDIAGTFGPVRAAGRMTRPGVVNAPSREDLFRAADQGFDKVRGTGVDYSSQSIKQNAADWQRALERDGFLSEDAPKTHALLNVLQTPPEGSVVPISGMMSVRKSLGNKAQNYTDPSEQKAASRAISSLDEYLSNPPDGSVIRGPAKEAAALYKDARGNYAAGSRSDTLEARDYRAGLNSDTANSGLNIDNNIRQQAKAILLNKKELSGFSQDEIAALEDVARGTPTRNAIRMAGNILGGGGGIGSAFTASLGAGIGGALGGPTGAAIGAGAIPVAGMTAKVASGKMTQRAFDLVDEMVRKRSPLYQQMQSQAPRELTSPLMQSLMLGGLLSQIENYQQ